MINYPTALLISIDNSEKIKATRLHYGTYPTVALPTLNEYYDDPIFVKDFFDAYMSNNEIREILCTDFTHIHEESTEFPKEINSSFEVEAAARILASQHQDIEYIYLFDYKERYWREIST